jgi:hypothetical protein
MYTCLPAVKESILKAGMDGYKVVLTIPVVVEDNSQQRRLHSLI